MEVDLEVVNGNNNQIIQYDGSRELTKREVSQLEASLFYIPERTSSICWNYFRLHPHVTQRTICIHNNCYTNYSYKPKDGTKNMIRHLEKHNISTENLDNYLVKNKGKNVSAVKYVLWIISDNRPFSIGETDAFADFLSDLKFTPPSLDTISGIRSKLFHKVEELVLPIVVENRSKICLIADTWSSCAYDSYTAAFVRYIDDEWKLNCFLLIWEERTDPHDTESLRNFFTENVTKKYGIEQHEFTIVSDSGPDFRAFRNWYVSEDQNWGCLAHTFHNCVIEAIKKTPRVASLVTKVKGIVTHFHQSGKDWAKFKRYSQMLNKKPNKFIQSVETRWNSTYQMLKSVLKQKDTFQEYDKELISEVEFGLLEQILEPLQKFRSASKTLECDTDVTSSKIYPTVNKIKNVLNRSNDFQYNLLLNLNDKFVANEIYLVCTFLDFRYKSIVGVERVSIVLHRLCPNPVTPAFSGNKRKKKDFLDDFERVDAISFEKEISTYASLTEQSTAPWDSPLSFWKENDSKYPNLANLAERYLAMPATSSIVERGFSSGTLMTSKLRNSLSPVAIHESQVVKFNYPGLRSHIDSILDQFYVE